MDQITPAKIEVILKRNWFQIAMLIILVIGIMKKDRNPGEPAAEAVPANYALSSTKKANTVVKETMGFGFLMSGKSDEKEVTRENKKYKGADFITRFSDAAKTESQKFDVPASVMLALGIYHRNSPKAFLAKKANNYFAIPCTASWYGSSVTHEDACYRSYKSAWFSFRDQNKYLNDLKEQGVKEMKNGPFLTIGDWARLLKRNGLIRNINQFENIVKSFDLSQYDEI